MMRARSVARTALLITSVTFVTVVELNARFAAASVAGCPAKKSGLSLTYMLKSASEKFINGMLLAQSPTGC